MASKPMTKPFAADFLSDRNYQQQQPNHFEIVIHPLTGEKELNFGDDVTFAVISFPIATRQNQAIEQNYGNTQVKFAGPTTFNGGDLVLRDFMRPDIEKKFNDWQNIICDETTGKMAPKADYATTATVYEYSADGVITRQWTLYGVWPSSVNPGELSHDNGGQFKNVTVTLEIDWASRDPMVNANA